MVSNEDLGLLYRICVEALEKYEAVPNRALKSEFNRRCPSGHQIYYLTGKELEKAMCLVGGEVFYRRSGLPWGIRRRGDYVAKIPLPVPY
jgi:hypothetical protein